MEGPVSQRDPGLFLAANCSLPPLTAVIKKSSCTCRWPTSSPRFDFFLSLFLVRRQHGGFRGFVRRQQRRFDVKSKSQEVRYSCKERRAAVARKEER
eukprot:764889-Hanusia_phi.AAC.5